MKFNVFVLSGLMLVASAFGDDYVNPIYLTVDAGHTNTLAEAIAAYNAANGTEYTVSSFNGGDLAAYTIVKKGDGMLRFNEAISGFTGKIYIEEGRAESSCVNALGNTLTASTAATYANGTFVCDGAALEMLCSSSIASTALDYEPITFEGTGPDGMGAYIQRWDPSVADGSNEGKPKWAFGACPKLSGDATFLLARKSAILASGQKLYPNGHTLTIKGPDNLVQPKVYISEGTIEAGGHVVFTNAALQLYYSPAILGDENDTITFKTNSTLIYYRARNAAKTRKLIMDGGSISCYTSTGDFPTHTNNYTVITNINQWSGPVELRKTTYVACSTSQYMSRFSFLGKVSGAGGIRFSDNTSFGHTYRNVTLDLVSPGNDFEGGLTMMRGVAYLHAGTSLPASGRDLMAENVILRLCAAMDDMYELPGASMSQTYTSVLDFSVIGGAGRWTRPFVQKGVNGSLLNYYSAVGGDSLIVSNGTFRVAKRKPGFSFGKVKYETSSAYSTKKTEYNLSTNSVTLLPEAFHYTGGGLWTGYSIGSYEGYLWNESETNETWTFAAAVRSWCKLYWDGSETPFLEQTAAGTPANTSVTYEGVKESITVTPGAHKFVVRYGKDDTTDRLVGPLPAANVNNMTWDALSGLMLDRLGRDSTNVADYQRIADPGDGSVVSLTANPDDALPPFKRIKFVNGTKLDLNGHATYRVCDFEGTPTVTNGGICVTGALYVAKSDLLAGRKVVVQSGSFAFAAGSQVVVDGLETLSPNGGEGYVVAVADGGVSGTAVAVSPEGPVRGWTVRPSSATTLSLVRKVGFSMAIR